MSERSCTIEKTKSILSDKIVVDFGRYCIACDEIYFNENNNSSWPPEIRTEISFGGKADLIMPLSNHNFYESQEKPKCNYFSLIESIAPVESNRQLLVEVELQNKEIEFFATAIEKKGGKYTDYNGYYYTNPIFKSPLLEELKDEPIQTRDINYRISLSMSHVFKWYPVFSLYKNSAKIKKVSLLRNSNDIKYFEEIEKVALSGARFHCASIILDSIIKDLPIHIDEKEKCIWGKTLYSECIGETFKKGNTGDFQYCQYSVFFYKAFPTRYSFKSFIDLLNNNYGGKDEEVDNFWKEYYKSDYYTKTINHTISLKSFLDEFDFTYVGSYHSDI